MIAPTHVHRGLCGSLLSRSRATWTYLTWPSKGATSGPPISNVLRLGEEALTELNLFMIQRANPRTVITYRFNKYEEHRWSGADWDWFLMDGQEMLGFRIQAKRYFPETRVIGEVKDDQLKTLLATSTTGMIPFYALYTAASKLPFAPEGCPAGTRLGTAYPLCRPCKPVLNKMYACSLVLAETVSHLRKAHKGGQKLAEEWARRAVPWHCFVCPGDQTGVVSPLELALTMAKDLYAGHQQRHPADEMTTEPPRLLTTLPEHAQRVWNAYQAGDAPVHVEEPDAENIPVKNVMMMDVRVR